MNQRHEGLWKEYAVDFIWASASQDRSSPENMILEFLHMTGIKIDTIRFDGAEEFGKSVSFQNFCNRVPSHDRNQN
jgi:hypothetical protein